MTILVTTDNLETIRESHSVVDQRHLIVPGVYIRRTHQGRAVWSPEDDTIVASYGGDSLYGSCTADQWADGLWTDDEDGGAARCIFDGLVVE